MAFSMKSKSELLAVFDHLVGSKQDSRDVKVVRWRGHKAKQLFHEETQFMFNLGE